MFNAFTAPTAHHRSHSLRNARLKEKLPARLYDGGCLKQRVNCRRMFGATIGNRQCA
jgi:hypothetical protein